MGQYISVPTVVEAAEIVAVVDFDPYETVCAVKVKNGGRVYRVNCHQHPEEGDFVISEEGDFSDGYLCPKDVFLKKYKRVGC